MGKIQIGRWAPTLTTKMALGHFLTSIGPVVSASFTDNFDTPPYPTIIDLSANWSIPTGAGQVRCISGLAYAPSLTGQAYYSGAGVVGADHSSAVNLGPGLGSGPSVRQQADNQATYWLDSVQILDESNPDATFYYSVMYLYRRSSSGVDMQIGSWTDGLTEPQYLRLSVAGSTLTLATSDLGITWIDRTTVVDATLANGFPGIVCKIGNINSATVTFTTGG